MIYARWHIRSKELAPAIAEERRQMKQGERTLNIVMRLVFGSGCLIIIVFAVWLIWTISTIDPDKGKTKNEKAAEEVCRIAGGCSD